MPMFASIRTRRRLIAFCAGVAALYLAVLSGQRAIDGYRARQEVSAVAREIEALRGHNVLLQRDLAVVQRDEEIERLARTELGFVKPGDRPVVLIWPDGQLPPDERARSRNERVEPVWRGWLRVFFDAE